MSKNVYKSTKRFFRPYKEDGTSGGSGYYSITNTVISSVSGNYAPIDHIHDPNDLIGFDITYPLYTNQLLQWNGSNWVERTPAAVAATMELDDLGNTTFTSLATNHVVRWDGSGWSNISPDGLAGHFNLTAINDMNFSGLSEGDVILYSAGSDL
jgi:hypothetical protein